MSQTNILLEAGTNELEIVEFYIDEPTASSFTGDTPETSSGQYRGYYGVNVAKVLEIIRLPKITGMPEVSHPSVMGAFNLRDHIIPLVDLSIWLDKQRQDSDSPKVIVTEFNNVTTSFLVSGVTRIHRMMPPAAGGIFLPLSPLSLGYSSSPKYARTTSGLAWISSGVPLARGRPKLSTVT